MDRRHPRPRIEVKVAEADAAQAAFEGYSKQFLLGNKEIDIDLLYRWSMRIASAPQNQVGNKEVYQAHLARMVELGATVNKRFQAGECTKNDQIAVSFSIAEAERQVETPR